MLARLPVDSFTVHRKRLATRASALDTKLLHANAPVDGVNGRASVEEQLSKELQGGHAAAGGHDGKLAEHAQAGVSLSHRQASPWEHVNT